MLKQRNRVVFLLFSLFVFAILAKAQQAKLLPPTPTELHDVKDKLDLKLLPEGAKNLEIEGKQVFNLVNSNTIQLTLVPVRFEIGIQHSIGESTISDCGIYLIPAHGAGSFIWTIGKEEELSGLVQCTGLQAVGVQSLGDSNPALILIYRAYTVHESFSQPYIFSWDKDSKKYQIDDAWDRQIAEESKTPTIRSIRRLMSKAK